MKLTAQHSDAVVLGELGKRLARARFERNLTQAKLAAEAGVAKRTIERLESGRPSQVGNLIRVVRALRLGDNLDLLVPETPPSPLEELELRGRQRERASRHARRGTPEPWRWEDDK
jgi:transcriptional regulator with XRE-family HTH domain